ncbi:pyocin activator PrtN family protein [Mesorhizobium sp.]|nr:MAG: hypothetical protein EOQ33_11415 [Mesorhizobium sp.]
MSLHTAFLLMAQYNSRVTIPLDEVRRDCRARLTVRREQTCS